MNRLIYASGGLAAAVLLLAGCSGQADEARRLQTTRQPPPSEGATPLTVETLADGLENPWSLAFLPDGSILFTERPGRLRRIENGWRAPTQSGFGAPRLIVAPIEGVPTPYVESQAGLFDVALSPDFATDRIVYLSYADGDAGANATKLVSATFDGDALSAVTPLYRTPADKATAAHFGGRIAIAPDGAILLTVGDGFDYREKAQALASGLGKIVRIARDGATPGDNPFADKDGALAQIWSYGHRNEQGLAIDPASGVVYESEHGPRGGDEINIILPGANYGWPLATFGLDYSGAQITPYTSLPGTVAPLHYWTPSIAPSGLAVYRGALFADWDGDLLVGALSFDEPTLRGLHHLTMENGKVAGDEIYLKGERVRDVRVGPDGAIYVATEDHDGAPTGKILRITPG